MTTIPTDETYTPTTPNPAVMDLSRCPDEWFEPLSDAERDELIRQAVDERSGDALAHLFASICQRS